MVVAGKAERLFAGICDRRWNRRLPLQHLLRWAFNGSDLQTNRESKLVAPVSADAGVSEED